MGVSLQAAWRWAPEALPWGPRALGYRPQRPQSHRNLPWREGREDKEGQGAQIDRKQNVLGGAVTIPKTGDFQGASWG